MRPSPGGVIGLHFEERSRTNSNVGAQALALALVITFCLAWGSPAALAQTTSRYPVVEGGVHPAAEIELLLRENHGVVLKDTRVTGTLSLDALPAVKALSAIRVTFDHFYARDGQHGHLYFSEIVFLERADFSRSEFEGLTLEFSTANGDVDFNFTRAGRLILRGTTFEGDTGFIGASVDSLHLGTANFEGEASFAGAELGEVNALRVASKVPIAIAWTQLETSWYRVTMRGVEEDQDQSKRSINLQNVEDQLLFWRTNFRDLGRDHDASQVNLELIRFRRAHFLTGTEAFATWLLELPTAYGTAPLRLFWFSCTSILAYAAIYSLGSVWAQDASSGKTPRSRKPVFLFGALYSIDSFVPVVSIFNASDWGWRVAEPFRWVEISERVLGLMVVSVAAYSVKVYGY